MLSPICTTEESAATPAKWVWQFEKKEFCNYVASEVWINGTCWSIIMTSRSGILPTCRSEWQRQSLSLQTLRKLPGYILSSTFFQLNQQHLAHKIQISRWVWRVVAVVRSAGSWSASPLAWPPPGFYPRSSALLGFAMIRADALRSSWGIGPWVGLCRFGKNPGKCGRKRRISHSSDHEEDQKQIFQNHLDIR